jgi:hypothetical protein
MAVSLVARTLNPKKRVEQLKMQYVKGVTAWLEWSFFSVLLADWADEVGDRRASAVKGGSSRYRTLDCFFFVGFRVCATWKL